MVLRISKTGAIYYEAPYTQAEQEEQQHPHCRAVPAANAIELKRFEAGRHAFVAVAGEVQVGWCIKRYDGWYIEGSTGGKSLAGPFRTLAAAANASQEVLAHDRY